MSVLIEDLESAVDLHATERANASSLPPTASTEMVVIEPKSRWMVIDFRELWQYRDLLWFLTWRGIKVLYAQSAIGVGWAVIQPLFAMFVYTIVFGKFAGIQSDGLPYAIFAYAALVPWTYFSNAVVEGTNSLVTNAQMITKVYFPRMILPLSATFAKLVDFTIALALLLVLMAWFGIAPTPRLIFLPLLIVIMVMTVAGIGMWFTALAIQYRDVKHGMTFAVQLLMYAAPVVYPSSLVPESIRVVYMLNPMAGVIDGFRAAFLGQPAMPWQAIAIGSVSATLILLSGAAYFRSREKIFADVA